MPASLPGATAAQNQGNPNQGQFVIFDPLSGPKGSPFDAMRSTGAYSASPVNLPVKVADPLNLSTGALSTGIGIGANRIIKAGVNAIFEAGYDDDMIPGQRQAYNAPPPKGSVSSNTVDSTRLYIGGGRMITNPAVDDRGVPFIPSPYTAGVAIFGAGNGGSRDAGTGPAFTGFELKTVTAAGTVANGAAIEGSWVNRSGVSLTIGQSAFGSSNAAAAVPALAAAPEDDAAEKDATAKAMYEDLKELEEAEEEDEKTEPKAKPRGRARDA